MHKRHHVTTQSIARGVSQDANKHMRSRCSHSCVAHRGVSASFPSVISVVLSSPPGSKYTGLDDPSRFSTCASSRLYPTTSLHLVHLNNVLFSNPSSLRIMMGFRSGTTLNSKEPDCAASVSLFPVLIMLTGGARIRALSWTGSCRLGSARRP